ncbi:MAG: VTT domain-containing protein [Planctomycetes bacterium]|nr:VTT domain-containing protein [Planctomycetota bacterium]
MDDLVKFFSQIYNVQYVVQVGGLAAMTAIVFAETGLMVGFFLPGDSLLVAAGLLTARGDFSTHVLVTCSILSVAAIVGDTVGYWFGAKTGPKLFTRDDSLFFKKRHLLTTRAFYERHGGKTIILARFVPIIRTFAPIVAGIGQMSYPRFLLFNVSGGIGWVWSLTLLGYSLGALVPGMVKRIDFVIIVVIAVSLVPVAITWWKNRGPTPAAGGTPAPETAEARTS